MVKGILADNDVRGQVDYLASLMQAEPWIDFWQDLGLKLFRFEDIGLSPAAADRDVWQQCQLEQLVLITGNRNLSGPDSLEATIRQLGTAQSLPVFTIADVNKLNTTRSYADEVVTALVDYLQRIDGLRGTGRMFLP